MKKFLSLLLLVFLLGNLAGCGQQPAQSAEEIPDTPLYLVLTVDTEDKYGNVPNMFECDFSDGTSCGVDYIMDTLESHDMKGVFFVNVYEEGLYSGEYVGYMEDLLKDIHNRGHEVGLHAHDEESVLPDYNARIFTYDLEKQTEILEWGCKYIEDAIGVRPISFRGGGYCCNEDTFQALENCGILYDSSYYYGNSGNKFQTYETLNQICKIGNLVEFPVVQTIRSDDLRSKLDFNNMPTNDIIAVLEEMKARDGFNAATLMFHSFSFMDQNFRDGVLPDFQEGTHNAYGANANLEEKFETVLNYIQNDPDIEVVTYQQIQEEGLSLVTKDQIDADGLFSAKTDSKTLAEFTFNPENPHYLADTATWEQPAYEVAWLLPQDVTVDAHGLTAHLENSYRKAEGDAKYSWYIVDCGSKEKIIETEPAAETTWDYTFSQPGTYLLYATVTDAKDKSNSKAVAQVDFKAGASELEITLANPS